MRARPLLIQSAGLAVERRGLTARIAAIVLALALVGLAWGTTIVFGSYEARPLLVYGLFAALVTALVSARVVLLQRFHPARSAASGARSRGQVALDEKGLTAQTRTTTRAYAPGSLADGWIDDPGEVVSVVLRARGGDVISIEVGSIEEARAILLAAGVSAEQQVLTMRLANAMTQIPLGGLLAALGGVVLPSVAILATLILFSAHGSAGTGALLLAPTLLLFGLLVRALIPQRIVIGTDGIALERVLGRVFVPHASVTEVVSAAGAVVLQLRDARPLRLPTGARYRGSRSRADESPHTALLHRLAEARAAGRAGSSRSRGVDAADLDRAGRALPAWREHLRGLTAASYRRPGVALEQIAAVLEDGGAPPERRVAAALALAPLGDAALKLRIEDIIRTSADASLRAALQAAAEDELTEAELSPLLKKQLR